MTKLSPNPDALNADVYPKDFAMVGINPAQQNRSRANFAALIRAGQDELNDKSLSEMRIEDVVQRAGTSVGAFYSRFTNKEAFFSAIQTITVKDVFRVLEIEISRIAEIEDEERMIKELAETWVDAYRRHIPIYIASARHVAVNREAWVPFRKLGQHASALVVKYIGPRLRMRGVQATEQLIPETLQFINGTLMNSVLNDPGPVSIGDPKMIVNITKFLNCFFSADDCEDPTVND
jgi:AcrR family transcriptional regulator